ncbi:molybdopterin-dependent oxidoreductase [Marinomonas mediterranea]|uniref:Oxidoreductase molybdopterin-binding domain-containing protein n=1 Tax=Marinomonas mediterranea (strain ATCC 700492 / JCM 21426 / NBRC 103028 / MMB-1) TaxID=717774 RepID=F2K283_MARM1|nr:molybdopterin-dependent oxidoreductase [Marinomonas mediterranea]ADZ91161.1 hypothetical protein Marme_1910 [Marinomonas mediterranea MMB-1]
MQSVKRTLSLRTGAMQKVAYATLFSAAVSMNAYALDAPEGRVVLTVTGKISEQNTPNGAEFDLAMLRELGFEDQVTNTPWTDGVNTYSGPRLKAVLEAVGASGSQMVVTALNDYSAIVPVADAKKHNVLLALMSDGKMLSVRDKGPIFVVYPFDDDPSLNNEVIQNRSVWQVKSIRVD